MDRKLMDLLLMDPDYVVAGALAPVDSFGQLAFTRVTASFA